MSILESFNKKVELYSLLECQYITFQYYIFLTGANNLVPMEIALKIAKKIEVNEPFAAYIVVPMWPEGVPTSKAVQEILFWQVRLNYAYLFYELDIW